MPLAGHPARGGTTGYPNEPRRRIFQQEYEDTMSPLNTRSTTLSSPRTRRRASMLRTTLALVAVIAAIYLTVAGG